MGTAGDIDTAKAEFKTAWLALKARTTPEQLAAAYRATNIRDDGYMPAGSRRQRSGRDWAELEHLLGVLIHAPWLPTVCPTANGPDRQH
jgi:hypothetical protein